jgi:hypothetical protein
VHIAAAQRPVLARGYLIWRSDDDEHEVTPGVRFGDPRIPSRLSLPSEPTAGANSST